MKYLWTVFVATMATIAVSAQQAADPWTAVPVIPATITIMPFQFPTDDLAMGEVPGIALKKNGHIFVYSRTGTVGPLYSPRTAQLFEFDHDGKFIREIGKNLLGMGDAHQAKVDRDDNLWIVDEGTNMVMKFNTENRVTQVIGRRAESVYPDQEFQGAKWHMLGELHLSLPRYPTPRGTGGEFNRPTDVAWDLEGNTFVGDGYNNTRIAKFDKNGDFIMDWGGYGRGPGQFNIIHAMANDAQGNIYVGDRGNNRIQVFDHNGKFLREFPNTNGQAICITPGPNQVLYTAAAGGILKLDLMGKPLGKFGKGGKAPDAFDAIHGIACPSETELYVGQVFSWRASKVILQPGQATTRVR